jgi:general secretion pathway protein N
MNGQPTARDGYPPKKTGRGVWVLTGALGLLIGVAVHAPARWLTQTLESVTQQHLRFPNVSGTVWQGSADLVLTGGLGSASAATLPSGIAWNIKPRWANGPALTLAVSASCCMSQALTGKIHWSQGALQVQVAPHTSEWPLGLLAGLGTPWNTVQLQGQLQTQLPTLIWRGATQGAAFSGEVVLQAREVSSNLSTLKPLGNYRMVFTGADAAAPPTGTRFSLETLRGDLQLSGQGEWDQGRFRFRGWAEAHPDRVGALSNLLNILGRRDGLRAQLSLG